MVTCDLMSGDGGLVMGVISGTIERGPISSLKILVSSNCKLALFVWPKIAFWIGGPELSLSAPLSK